MGKKDWLGCVKVRQFVRLVKMLLHLYKGVLAFCVADCVYEYLCALCAFAYWEQVLSLAAGWTWGQGLVLVCQICPCSSNKEVVSGYSWLTASFILSKVWLVVVLEIKWSFCHAHLYFVFEEEQRVFSNENDHTGSDQNSSTCLRRWQAAFA